MDSSRPTFGTPEYWLADSEANHRPVGMAGGVTLAPASKRGDDGCCHKTRLAGARCPIARECPYDLVSRAVASQRGDDLTADFMSLAGSHMATTKVLARLVHAGRKLLGAWPSGGHSHDFLMAVEAAEKDLGL